MSPKEETARNFATNRAASFNYHILERIETGLVLTGAEVKSVRAGSAVLKDAFAAVRDGEIFLHNVHISPYSHAPAARHEPERSRKLLLHKRQILKLHQQTRQEGLTLVPLRLYLKDGKIKCELGVAKGKKVHDKRATRREEEARRDLRDTLARRRKAL
jgi:SsrA-binding protein